MSHLLEIHGRAPSQDTEAWRAENTAFRERLKKAREDLSLYPVEWLEMQSPSFTE